MRVLIFHGYLLRGTGSNIYNAELARSLLSLGHEVHLFCQDSHAADLQFVDAVGRWPDGRLEVEVVRRPVRCITYLPDIGGLLPVYVADPYEGFAVRTFPQLTDTEIDRYLAANVAAVHDVVAAVAPDVALANHLVMGPVILARALAGQIPYAVKIHGSALEYVVRPHQTRFRCYASEGLAGASAVVVGSRHVAESLGLRELIRSLGDGDIAAARDIARRGHEFQGGPRGELRYLAGFLDGLRGAERERYAGAGPRAMRRVHFIGRIEHGDIPDVMCASEAVVVPSTFPEAFGMVVAEAACCGALPLAAAHSGLREVAAQLAPALGEELSVLLTFTQGRGAVHEIAGKLTAWLTFAPNAPAVRRRAREALADLARSRFSWQQTAEGVIAAAQGRLCVLAPVPGRTADETPA